MAMRKTSRNHIEQSMAALKSEPTRLEGFVPLLPERKEFVDDLNQIIKANEGSSRADSHSCWLPLDEDFKRHRQELSQAIEDVANASQGGRFRPMAGDDIVITIELVLPAKRGRRQFNLHDAAQTFYDAMRFNRWTADEKRLGLVAEGASVVDMRLSKRIAEEGEEAGTRFVVEHAACEAEPMRATDWNAGLGRRVALLSAVVVDEESPLSPEVVDFYRALRQHFDARVSRQLAIFEQTRLNVALLDGQDAEQIALEIATRTASLEALGERSPSLAELEG